MSDVKFTCQITKLPSDPLTKTRIWWMGNLVTAWFDNWIWHRSLDIPTLDISFGRSCGRRQEALLLRCRFRGWSLWRGDPKYERTWDL